MSNSFFLILISTAVFFVLLSALFSGAETGIYRLSLIRLRFGVEKKQLSSRLLARLMQDRKGLLISLLTGTNLAYYLVTSIVTYILMAKFTNEHTVELITTAIITPILFVFSELLPKNIFFYRCDFLMPYVAVVLFAFHKLFTYCGIVPLLKGLSKLLSGLSGSGIQTVSVTSAIRPSYMKNLFRETRDEDFLSTIQTDMMYRLADISNLTLKTVMTPLNKVKMVDKNSDRNALLECLKDNNFTRMPVYQSSHTDIVGFINIYDCLSPAEPIDNLSNFIKPVRQLSVDTTVIKAINTMRIENHKIVLVTGAGYTSRGKVVGIITMKDLVEEILGELSEW